MMTHYEMEMYARAFAAERRQEAKIWQMVKAAKRSCTQQKSLKLATKMVNRLIGRSDERAAKTGCTAAA